MKQNHKAGIEKEGFLRDDERACCDPSSPCESKNGSGCLETWKQEFKTASSDYLKSAATASKEENSYTNAIAWEAKLRIWVENAEKAHEEAELAYMDLEAFILAVKRLSSNTGETSTALRALLCLLKRIFERIDKLLFKIESEEEASDLLKKLKEMIKCSTDLNEQKKQAALDCVAVYEAKVQVINNLQTGIMTKMLDILYIADLLQAYMAQDEFGLHWQLEDLRKRLLGNISATDKISLCHKQHERPKQDKSKDAPIPPCDPEIGKPAKDQQLLPIRKMKPLVETNSAYYDKVSELFASAKTSVDDSKAAMDEARKQRDTALARKNSLSEAIKASEAAEAAK